jgi:GNAT superfamily N-acetyltransferase
MSSFTLRPISDEDLPFLRALYGSTRAEELAVVDWDDATREAFLDQQFSAQHEAYQAAYPGEQFSIVERDGVPVGRLYVARRPHEIRVVDVALIPAARGQNVGTALLQGVIDEAEGRGVPVGIHVEKFNPALRLYERLGFEAVADREVYWYLERRPRGAPAGV